MPAFQPQAEARHQWPLCRTFRGPVESESSPSDQHTVRVGTALLEKLCKLPRKSNGELNADDSKLADRLTRCYIGLMFELSSVPTTDTAWIRREREALCFLRNLIWAQKMLNNLPSPLAPEWLTAAHQRLCFPAMTPCMALHISLPHTPAD